MEGSLHNFIFLFAPFLEERPNFVSQYFGLEQKYLAGKLYGKVGEVLG